MSLVAEVTPARILRFVVVIASALAATSVGGLFFAGVVLVPLLILFSRRAKPATLVLYAVHAAVLTVEVAWGITYLAVGESQPWIWLVALLGGVAAVAAALYVHRRAAPILNLLIRSSTRVVRGRPPKVVRAGSGHRDCPG